MKYLIENDGPIKYILQVVPISILSGVFYMLFRHIYIKIKKAHLTWQQELLRIIFACYCGALFALVLTPNNFWTAVWFYIINGYPGCKISFQPSFEFNFIPTMILWLKGSINVGGWTIKMLFYNLLLFVPMGVLLPELKQKAKRGFIQVLILGFFCSFAVELFQPLVGRSFDIDDIIMNVLGVMLGYIVYQLLVRLSQKIRGAV